MNERPCQGLFIYIDEMHIIKMMESNFQKMIKKKTKVVTSTKTLLFDPLLVDSPGPHDPSAPGPHLPNNINLNLKEIETGSISPIVASTSASSQCDLGASSIYSSHREHRRDQGGRHARTFDARHFQPLRASPSTTTKFSDCSFLKLYPPSTLSRNSHGHARKRRRRQRV